MYFVSNYRFYVRNKHHKLRNAPYVDNSCKWAGGGFLSNVNDLVKFGNAMLYSFQKSETSDDEIGPLQVDFKPGPYHAVNEDGRQKRRLLPGYLKKSIMRQLWKPVIRMNEEDSLNNDAYGMGWMIRPMEKKVAHGRNQEMLAYHTGGAVGASSVLLILPGKDNNNNNQSNVEETPVTNGVVVAVICNMQGVGFTEMAYGIAKEFENCKGENEAFSIKKVYTC